MRGHRLDTARRRLSIISALVVALVFAVAIAAPAGAQGSSHWSGYATATVVHADLLQSGTTRVIDAEEGFSGAAADSEGLGSATQNEVERQVSPALANKHSYSRGSGLEAGLAQSPTTENQLILAGKSDSSAPPTSSGSNTKELGPVAAAPLLYASLLRGQSVARWNPSSCVLGEDVARGLGFAADAQVLDSGAAHSDGTLGLPLLAVDAPGPERAVAQSTSRLRLVRQVSKTGHVVGPNFGLLSETRATIAPVTLFRGTPMQITLEFLGEWVLQAVATGVPGYAYVHYGPGTVTPETPVLRTINALGIVTNILTTQQILGPKGLNITVPGLAEIAIGEQPRAIGGGDSSNPAIATNGTSASAAVDVVRVRVLPSPTLHAADVRVGHMEVKAQVPAGGITCGLPVTKTPDPAHVSTGERFTTTITITNPFNCELNHVNVKDHITTEGSARFAVVSTSPPAGRTPEGEHLDRGDIEWSDIGSIPAHSAKSVKVEFDAQDGAGEIIDTATASGTIGDCAGEATTVSGVATSIEGASASGESPELVVPVTKVLGKVVERLPSTGLEDIALVALGVLFVGTSGALLRIMRRT